MPKRLIIGAALLAVLAAPPVSASPVFFDNFDSEHGGVGVLNYNSFVNFGVSGGTVDLIGNGFWSFSPVTDGHGLYVDLDGSTSSAGLMLANPIAVTPGIYDLTFQLAGNQRNGGDDIVEVDILFDDVPFLTAWFDVFQANPFGTGTVPFGISTPGNLRFSFRNTGGDNVGALLDNIVLTERRAVPEPASLLLIGTGLLGTIAARRRRT